MLLVCFPCRRGRSAAIGHFCGAGAGKCRVGRSGDGGSLAANCYSATYRKQPQQLYALRTADRTLAREIVGQKNGTFLHRHHLARAGACEYITT